MGRLWVELEEEESLRCWKCFVWLLFFVGSVRILYRVLLRVLLPVGFGYLVLSAVSVYADEQE